MEEGGPHVSIVSAQVDGYGVEVERTFFLGNVPEISVKPFKTTMAARAPAYDQLKPGIVMSEAGSAVVIRVHMSVVIVSKTLSTLSPIFELVSRYPVRLLILA